MVNYCIVFFKFDCCFIVLYQYQVVINDDLYYRSQVYVYFGNGGLYIYNCGQFLILVLLVVCNIFDFG